MAKNNWSSDAFKKAQNLLSPGYNSLDTFEPVTTLSKDDAMALARNMKLDMGVKGYGNTSFDDNQASIGAYFPNMNEAESLPLDLDNESSITSRDLSIPTPSKNLSNVNYQNPTVELNAAQKALNALSLALSDGGVKPFKDGKVSGESFYIRDKYNEIFNNGSSSNARDKGNVMEDTDNFMSLLKDMENSELKGFSNGTGTWNPHESKEGGTDTIAYGHKLLPEEQEGGYVMIGDEPVPFNQMTMERADELLNQDWSNAKIGAEQWMGKGWSNLSEENKTLATELVFNMGLAKVSKGEFAFKKFKAKALVNAPDTIDEIGRTYLDKKTGKRLTVGRVKDIKKYYKK